MPDIPIVVVIIGVLLVLALIVTAVAKRYRIPSANQALVVTGSGSKDGSIKVVVGSGSFIIPFVQQAKMIALDAAEIPMQVPEGVTKDNIKVVVDAVALAKIEGTPDGVRAAAQRFLGREDEIPRIVTSILAGTLRGVVGNMSVDEMLRDREGLARQIQSAASQALSDAGLRVDTLQINGIATDPPDYIVNLGRPQAAAVRKEAEVAEAINAQESAKAQALSRIAIASANKDAQIQEAEFQKQTSKAQAEAAAVGPRTQAEQAALVTRAEQENAKEKASLTKLMLDSDVRAKADASLYQAEQEAKAKAAQIVAAADAEQKRLTSEGQGRADAIRSAGEAEAAAIKAKGQAEAEVKELLAAAYAKYGEQAIIDRVLGSMPDMIAAAAKPIGDIDNITVVGDGSGASRITKLSTDVLVELPALVKATTGLDLNSLFAQWFDTKMIEAQDAPSQDAGAVAIDAGDDAPHLDH
ncbi:MAG: hypothetical protein LBM23_06055 [Propionibacteriaceae bacterium]|jgi:flotillin|nr:hypothetical protein [Propionibacteriaceae bacterium]